MLDIELRHLHVCVNGEECTRFYGDLIELRQMDSCALLTFDNTSDKGTPRRNIWAFDQNGELWRIQRCPDTSEGESDRWIGTKLADGEVWAIPEQDDREYRIDLDTGEILESRAA